MAPDTYIHASDGRTCILKEDGTWFVPLDAGGEGFFCERGHGGLYHSLVRAGSAATCICGEWEPKLGESVLRSFDEHLLEIRQARPLPLHRTEAGYPRCSTCDGGGCLDCTDQA